MRIMPRSNNYQGRSVTKPQLEQSFQLVFFSGYFLVGAEYSKSGSGVSSIHSIITWLVWLSDHMKPDQAQSKISDHD